MNTLRFSKPDCVNSPRQWNVSTLQFARPWVLSAVCSGTENGASSEGNSREDLLRRYNHGWVNANKWQTNMRNRLLQDGNTGALSSVSLTPSLCCCIYTRFVSSWNKQEESTVSFHRLVSFCFLVSNETLPSCVSIITTQPIHSLLFIDVPQIALTF